MPQLDPLEIIAKVQGEQEVRRLEEEIKKAAEEIENLSRQFGKSAQEQDRFRAAAEPFAQTIATNSRLIEEQAKALGGLGGSFQNMGRGMLQASYFFDDLQYGLRAIVNNIPQVVTAFGGTAGLAGAIGIVAVGANVLVSHWDDLLAKLGYTSDIDRAKSSIELLGDAIDKVGDAIENASGKKLDIIEDLRALVHGGIESQPRKFEEARRAEAGAQERGAANPLERSKEEVERGAMFDEARKAYGPRRLENEITERMVREEQEQRGLVLSPAQKEFVREQARQLIGKGVLGRFGPHDYDIFGSDFKEEYSATVGKHMDVKARARERQEDEAFEARLGEIAKEEHIRIDAVRKSQEKRKRHWEGMMRDAGEEEQDLDRQNKEARRQFEEDKRIKREGIEDKIEKLNLRRENLQEAFSHTGHSETMSARQYATKITQGGFDQVSKDQLATLRGIKIILQGYQKQLRNIGRMRWPENN